MMSVSVRAGCISIAVVAAFAGAPVAHAEEGSSIGGSVPSMLALSLTEPSGFSRATVGRRRSVYTSVVGVEVTATDAPTRLSVADGEVTSGRRRGRLVNGASVLVAPLQAAAARGAFKSLDATVDPLLEQWSEPVASAETTITLRQATRGTSGTLGNYHKLLLVTITAASP